MFAAQLASRPLHLASVRFASTHARFVVVGGGTAGVTVSAQLQRAFKAEGREIKNGDIAIIDPAKLHHYQPGWTLVGSGLAELEQMNKPLQEVIPSGVKHYSTSVTTFSPESNSVKTADGSDISYDYLIVAPGLKSDFGKIPGLLEGLKDAKSGVSSIYHFDSVQKAWNDIKNFKHGTAIFTQPAGIIKCAGAPQKIMWMALSQWNKEGVRDQVELAFATGTPTMFGVPKYSKALEQLRVERNVDGLFSHNLAKIDNATRTATFDVGAGKKVEKKFDLLHVVPPQCPPDFIKDSPLADAAGWVAVNPATTQHVKYPNVFSIGDASSLPNSKTAAAITAQAPVLVDNLRAAIDGKALPAVYDGYASCPLLTGHNELMLAEFKYGGVPKETFSRLPFFESQDKPNATFFWLKKEFFPRIYWNAFLKIAATDNPLLAVSSQDYKFEGWGAFDKTSVEGNFKKFEYQPKKWDETDVDIKILYCGVCASDLHTASSGWGEVDYPQVVGHEIVGYAVKVGSEVKHIKVGDLVGVGAQNDSCLECDQCKIDREMYCSQGQVGTYAGVYKKGNGKGDKSYGGYASYHRAPGHFVLKVPEGLDPALAAPMMCGGVTVYSPLTQYGAGKTAKDVGIVGIGGLGHFGLLFAKALGANVTAISHSASKKGDAEKMGATRFIESGDGSMENFAPYKRSLDLIIATTNDAKMPLLGYLSLLRPGGNFILVGAPEEPLPSFPAFPLLMNNVHIGGSAIGSPKIIAEMLELAAKQKIHPWIIKRPLDDVNNTVNEMRTKGAKYRFVLVNEENGGKLD